MKRLTSSQFNLIFLLFLFLPALFASVPTTAQAQTTTAAAFSRWELFKNSDFNICSNDSDVQTVVSRSPKGGHGGGGHSSGGHSSGGGKGGSHGGSSGPSGLITEVYVKKGGSYCQYMNGTGVILPTLTTQSAYYPLWPQYLAWSLSTAPTFLVFWHSFNTMGAGSTHGDRPLLLFWMMVPIDAIRCGLWLVITFWGLVNNKYLTWMNPTVWVIPHAYIWMMKAIRLRRRQVRGLEESAAQRYEMSVSKASSERKNSSASNTSYEPVYTFDSTSLYQTQPYQSQPQFLPYRQYEPDRDSQHYDPYHLDPQQPVNMPPAYSGPSGQKAVDGSDLESLLAEYTSMYGPPRNAKDEHRRREMLRKHPETIKNVKQIFKFLPGMRMDAHPHSARIMYGALLLAAISVLMWILTFANVVMHWESNSPKTRGYYLDPKVAADPKAIGNGLPDNCTSWLGSTDLGDLGFFKQTSDHYVARIIPMALFVLTWRAIVILLLKVIVTDRSKPDEDGNKPKSTEDIIKSELKYFILLIPVALLCAAVVTGTWVVVENIAMKHSVQFKYTNNVSKTGGCTFGMVNMEKRWGFWDVKEGLLVLRILLAAAGVAT